MKPRFAQFTARQPLNEGMGYGIAHVEDLDVETFIRSLENLHQMKAVQKLDGANLVGGFDVQGVLYASREQKGGKRFYDQKDFPDTSSYDAFRAALAVLKRIEDDLRTIVAPGEAFSLEVLFGEQPNTVFYGKDGFNYLAFLEMVQGDDPSKTPKQHKIDEIMDLIGDRVIAVKSVFSDTTDGVQINRTGQLSDWKLTTSDKVPSLEVRKVDVTPELQKLKIYLNSENDAAAEQGKDLTNYEVLKDRSRDLNDERDVIQDTIMKKFKLPIKRKLLAVAEKQKPSLRGGGGIDDGTYDGIEGIIFVDPETNERFKVVDRDVFTRINQFNYQVRKTIAGRITTNNPNLPIEARGGIVGEAKLRCVNLFSLENAEIPSQVKNTIEKLRGDTREETVMNVVATLKQLNFEAIRRKMQAIYVNALVDLEDSLDEFKMHADEYELQLENGKTVKYTPEVRRRTLLVFAEAKRDLHAMLKKLQGARDMEDLLEVFFSKQFDAVAKKPAVKKPIKKEEGEVE